MTVEYVDAGEAINQGELSGKTAGGDIAPPVVADLNYERIRNARSEPHNWITYYGAYDGQRLQPARPDQHRERQAHRARVDLPGGHERHHRRRVDLLVRGRPDHRRRDHVPLRLGRLGLGPRREDGHRDLALQARHPLRRLAVLRQREPRGRGGQGQGLLRHGQRPPARARRHQRPARVGQDLRRRAGRGERHGRSAGREEHGHRGELRRRVRGARPPRRVRHRDRRARLALLHGAEARGARLRDLARRRRGVGARRRRTAGSPAPSTPRRTCSTWAPATRRRTSTARSARATTSTPTASSRWTSTRVRSAGTTSAPRTTCGTTTASPSASCSRRTGGSCSGTSTRTATSSSSTAPTARWCRSPPSSTGSTGGRSPGTARSPPRDYPDKEGDPVHFYPGPAGSKEWTHAAYSPRTELFYVPVQDVGATATRRRREFKESIPYWGAGVAGGHRGHGGVRQRVRRQRRGEVALAQRAPDVCVGAGHRG